MKKLIISFAILLAVVVIIGCTAKTTVYPPQGEVPSAQPSAAGQPSAPSVQPAASLPAPQLEETTIDELRNCESNYAIGWVPNSCSYEQDNFKITLKAVGQGGIDGIVFYIIGPTDMKTVLEDSTRVDYGKEQAYSFSPSELQDKVGGSVHEITALPVKSVDGVDYACFNQRLLVIKDEACRS